MSRNPKVKALFSAIKSLFAEMTALTTDCGTIFYEGDLEVGTVVFTDYGLLGDAKLVAVKDDKKIQIEVVGGTVTSITDYVEPAAPAEGEQAGDPANFTETEEPAPAAPAAEGTASEGEGEGGENAEPSDIEQLQGQVTDLTNRIVNLENTIANLSGRLAELEQAPADEKPDENYKKADLFAQLKAIKGKK